MLSRRDSADVRPYAREAPAAPSELIPLDEIDSPPLLKGIAFWRGLCAGRSFPARENVTPRGLTGLLRNTALLRVIDGGKDYEYRIVGDAYVMAHGASFQGMRWSETSKLWPGYQTTIKSACDRVVGKAEPVAMRGWIERDGRSAEVVYGEYAFLPLGRESVDHILTFAVYISRGRTAPRPGWNRRELS